MGPPSVSPSVLSWWHVWHCESGCQVHQTPLHNLNSDPERLPTSWCCRATSTAHSQAPPAFPLAICPARFRHFSSLLLRLQTRRAVGRAVGAQRGASTGSARRQPLPLTCTVGSCWQRPCWLRCRRHPRYNTSSAILCDAA